MGKSTIKKLLSNLIKPKKKIAGLDIGNSSIKIMEIEGDTLQTAKVTAYAIEQIPQNVHSTGEEGDVSGLEIMAEIVRKCWKKSGITTKNVAISLSSSDIITKKFRLPVYDNEEELQLAVETEMAKFLPSGMTISEVSLDYTILGQDDEVPPNYEVAAFAAKKEKIDEKVAIVEAAGLIPIILDVEQYAIRNLLSLMKGDEFIEKTYLVLDGSATSLRMLVFRKGEIISTRETPLGGLNLTEEIMSNLDLSFSDVENMKIHRTGDETYDVIEKNFLNNYTSEIIRMFQYFASSTLSPEIDQVILCGGVANIPNISETLREAILDNNEKYIKSEPYIARPLSNIQKNEKINIKKFEREEASLFLVTSLALRHFLRQY